MQANMIFITGTDTGAGKTLFTCMGLCHLRNAGTQALGLKPFCSGSRSDARHIRFHTNNQLPLDVVNPWFFEPPISPGAMPKKDLVSKHSVKHHILQSAETCETLLVEGAGGLMSPLGVDYHFGDLIQDMQPKVVLTAPNRLGVLNQVLLNVDHLKRFIDPQDIHVVLMGQKNSDLSVKRNAKVLKSWIHECTILEIPYLGARAKSKTAVQQHANKYKRRLAIALDYD